MLFGNEESETRRAMGRNMTPFALDRLRAMLAGASGEQAIREGGRADAFPVQNNDVLIELLSNPSVRAKIMTMLQSTQKREQPAMASGGPVPMMGNFR